MSNGIEIQLKKIYMDFTNDVEVKAKKEFDDISKEGQAMLKRTSPHRTGAYASGWKISNRQGAVVIHNQDHWMLTHLLEKGHASRNGGRVPGKVHIATVQKWIEEEIPKRIEKSISK